jgi:hypothetical protein
MSKLKIAACFNPLSIGARTGTQQRLAVSRACNRAYICDKDQPQVRFPRSPRFHCKLLV